MKSILIVDDNEVCRAPIAEILRRKGYQILEAANGQDALQIIQTILPELVLLDVAMPQMDGLTCLRELRNRPDTAQPPVIMLTGVSEKQILNEAAQLGAESLLKSSLSSEALMSRVQVLIGGP